MLPSYERLDDGQTKAWLKIPFGQIAVVVVSLPLLAFLFCVLWSVLYFFEESTATHCRVSNYLPSISAAIGNYQPQRFVWQVAIILHFVPRLLIANEYAKHYAVIIRMNRRPVAYTACLFNAVENFALLGLSLWTSVTDYGARLTTNLSHKCIFYSVFLSEIHKTCFIVFIATSECYMLMTYFVNKNARKILDSATRLEARSLRYKRNLFLINIVSFSLAGYFFLRHNSNCEAGGECHHNNVNIFGEINFFFFSIHFICFDGIFGGADKHGLSHDGLLGFS